MSSEQGPHAKRGDVIAANAAGRRQHGRLVWFGLTEASGMKIKKRLQA